MTAWATEVLHQTQSIAANENQIQQQQQIETLTERIAELTRTLITRTTQEEKKMEEKKKEIAELREKTHQQADQLAVYMICIKSFDKGFPDEQEGKTFKNLFIAVGTSD